MNKLYKLFEEKKIKFYQTDRLSLDNYYYESYQDDKEEFVDKEIFETEKFGFEKKLEPYYKHSPFRYFLDGSRKPYKIGDIVTTDNKFVPVVVGQVLAGCCYRDEDKKIKKYDIKRKNVLMLYSSIQKSDLKYFKDNIEKDNKNGINIELQQYKYEKLKDEAPTNAAIAKIQLLMQGMELNLIEEMVESGKLSDDQMMIIDGSLQFFDHKYDPRIFDNVIGISKSYNPNLTGILKRDTQIGVALSELKYGERTQVYRYKTERTKNTIGAWYLRIRDNKYTRNPLEGVIKVEKMAMAEDEKFDSEMIDNISKCLLAERNPTCHGNDSRWANHLYPIYLTEKMLKASFLSDTYFMNIF